MEVYISIQFLEHAIYNIQDTDLDIRNKKNKKIKRLLQCGYEVSRQRAGNLEYWFPAGDAFWDVL